MGGIVASIWDWTLVAADNDNSDTGIDWTEGQTPKTVNNSGRQMMGRIAELLADVGGTKTTGGSANAQTITANSAFTAYETGIVIAFKAGFTNTGAATLNANGIGAKSIRKFTHSGEFALDSNDIVANGIYVVRYDAAANSSAGAWILQNPSQALLRRWNLADTDIDGLLPGTQGGTILEGQPNGHVVIGVRGNDADDRFAVIGRASGSTYDTLLLDVTVEGIFSVLGSVVRTENGGLMLESKTVAQLNAIASSAATGEAYLATDLPGESFAVPVYWNGTGFVKFA